MIFFFFFQNRCRNSIDILIRQEKAEKLNTCICDGNEGYNCKGIHRNMNVLCFGKKKNYNRKKPIQKKPKNKEVKPVKTYYASGNQGLSLRMELLLGVVLIFILKGKYIYIN